MNITVLLSKPKFSFILTFVYTAVQHITDYIQVHLFFYYKCVCVCVPCGQVFTQFMYLFICLYLQISRYDKIYDCVCIYILYKLAVGTRASLCFAYRYIDIMYPKLKQ